MQKMRRARETLTPIADTSDLFSDFGPYVAAINETGTVAFQATLCDGSTGVFTGNGGTIAAFAEQPGTVVSRFYSHPDIDREGTLCVYGVLTSGHEAILLVKDGEVIPIADTSGLFRRIGPLGPTMNDGGAVAFRADTREGRSGVFAGSSGSLVMVADTVSFEGFQGLPVINRRGTIIFRADLSTGGHGIYLSRGQGLEAVAVTGDRFHEIGFFPSANNDDTVAFSATLTGGGAGVFSTVGGRLNTIADTDGAFETFRGALINDSGTVFFYATPRGGRLGIYAGADPVKDAILAIGDPFLDSTVVEFALNPVSINDRGQLAIRIRLANARQLIVRAEPAG